MSKFECLLAEFEQAVREMAYVGAAPVEVMEAIKEEYLRTKTNMFAYASALGAGEPTDKIGEE